MSSVQIAFPVFIGVSLEDVDVCFSLIEETANPAFKGPILPIA
jgi:hypothetical protein